MDNILFMPTLVNFKTIVPSTYKVLEATGATNYGYNVYCYCSPLSIGLCYCLFSIYVSLRSRKIKHKTYIKALNTIGNLHQLVSVMR